MKKEPKRLRSKRRNLRFTPQEDLRITKKAKKYKQSLTTHLIAASDAYAK